ncbi:MAG: hypothetical protein AAFO94_12510, partial [Bacteroidota bacterium]
GDLAIEHIDTEEIISGLNSMFFDYKIKVPPNLLLLLKALIMIEGVGLELDPQYNIVKNIDPYARKLMMQRINPLRFKSDYLQSLMGLTKMAVGLPEDLSAIVSKIKAGKLHIEFEHKGLKPLLQKMEVVTNRMAFAMLLLAIILGSSWIIAARIPPFVNDISLLGVIGFSVAGLLALRLMYSIIRHGNF